MNERAFEEAEASVRAETLQAYIAGLDDDRRETAAKIANVLANGNSIRMKESADPALVAAAATVLEGFANVLGEPLVLKREGEKNLIFKPSIDGVAEAEAVVAKGARTRVAGEKSLELLDDSKDLGIAETKPMPVVTDRTPVEPSGGKENKIVDLPARDSADLYDARKDPKTKQRPVTGSIEDVTNDLLSKHKAESERRALEASQAKPKSGFLGGLFGGKKKKG